MNTTTEAGTVRDLLARMDDAWAPFRQRVNEIPSERLEMHIGDGGWTRKQMLAHIGAWHDATTDRLSQFGQSGELVEPPGDEDAFNAHVARAAEGRTTGEVLLGMDDTYRRLHREVANLSDAQLAAHDAWASAIIIGNTVDHYADHLEDLGEKRA